MSNGALDRATFEAIEAYVLDRMTAAEREAFELRMSTDGDFRAEVEVERDNIRAVELGGGSRLIKDISAEENGRERAYGGWSRYVKYAAVVALLATAAIWWFTRPPVNERLFAEYYAADPGLPVAMSGTTDPAFADAMVAYKLGDHAEARSKWAPLLQNDPTNDTLRYYTASAALAMGDAALAIPLFEGLASGTGSAFQVKSRWFLFLAYVKQGNAAKARAVPLDDDPVYGERARALKAQLP